MRTWSAVAERLHGWSAAEVTGKLLPTAARQEMVFLRKLIADTMSGSPLYQADTRRNKSA